MDRESEIESCRRLLGEIGEMCENATDGQPRGGSRRTARRYNALLNRLVELECVPRGVSEALPEEAAFAEIGVEARMLASYLPKNKDKDRKWDWQNGDKSILIRLAPFVGKEDLGLLVREQIGKGNPIDMDTLTGLAPFLGQDILHELLRAHLDAPKARPEPSVPPVPPAPTAAPAPGPRPTAHPVPHVPAPSPMEQAPRHEAPAAPQNAHPLQSVDTSAAESVDDILDLLKSPYLSDEQRNELVERLRAR